MWDLFLKKILIIDRKNSDLQVTTLSLSLETISSTSKLSSWLSKYSPRNTMSSPILVLISVSLQIWIGKTTANSSKHGVLKQVIRPPFNHPGMYIKESKSENYYASINSVNFVITLAMVWCEFSFPGQNKLVSFTSSDYFHFL